MTAPAQERGRLHSYWRLPFPIFPVLPPPGRLETASAA